MAGRCVTVALLLVSALCVLEASAQARSRGRSRSCISCSVNGKLYDGHSRFQYEEGCNRYRCVCKCDGSHNCPAQYTENICRDKNRSNSTSSRRSRTGCQACVVNGKEHPGHTYFKHAEGCWAYDNCICYCNGTWVCPENRARNTCTEGTSGTTVPSTSTNSTSRANTGGDSSSRQAGSANGTSSGRGRGREQGRTRNGRTDNRDNRRRGCMNCTVDGKEYKGNAYFDLVQGCKSYKYCICYCNGSWNCPDRFAKDTCTGDKSGAQTQQGSRCQDCSVGGNTFPGNRYFKYKDGCLEYSSCVCHCNGSWSCPDTGARNVCNEAGQQGSGGVDTSSTCQDCSVRGQTFRGNTRFQVTDSCIEYNDCTCFCNGSWHCPSTRAKNVCDTGSTSGSGNGDNQCRACVVREQTFANGYFQMTDGCTEFRDCKCNCDGSWQCPDTRSRNICQTSSNATDASGTGRCDSCQVYGNTFPGNGFFQVRSGCVEYSNCFCHCNGSWACPSDSATNLCEGERRNANSNVTTGIGRLNTGCKTCFAYGKQFEGNDYFDVTDGCTKYRNCVCRCDGSWNCPSRYSTKICESGGSNSTVNRPGTNSNNRQTKRVGTNGCYVCEAKGKVVEGNTYFEISEGCIEYKNCACHCDGSWECPPQFAKNVCKDKGTADNDNNRPTQCSSCVAKGKYVTGGSTFELVDGCNLFRSCQCNCDGSWECLPESHLDICFGNATNLRDRCSVCKSSDGKLHPPNKRFSFVDECIQYNCDCHCNGSWNCPSERSKWVCTDKCLKCDVEGRKVENNTVFTHKTGCLEYTCNCYCNGSWSCPGSSVRNTCPVDVRDNCNKCVVSPTEKYEGESNFVLKQGCLHYQCRCNCDGTYHCPGKDARNVCRGEALGGCRSCVISDTEIYKGQTDFSLKRDCFHYQCHCNCDGSWNCPIDKARDVCLGEVPGGCRVCRVSDTEVYRSSSTFYLRKDCIHYKCKCNCDGGWNCPAEDSRNICKGEVPGGCRSCIISENEFFRGNTQFEMVKDCIHYRDCRCNCDGSYRCPGRNARRVCTSEGAVVPEPSSCGKCKVANNKEYNGNTTFNLDRACYRYECSCSCDGSWECPPDKTKYVCTDRSGSSTSTDQCRECKIGRAVYPGGTVFKYTQRCYQFDCTCDCNGRYSCDYQNPVNSCQQRNRPNTFNALVSNGSSSDSRSDYTASNQGYSRQSQTGSSVFETDIKSENGRSQNRNNNGRGRTATERTQRRCKPCIVGDRALQENAAFNVDAGCTRYERCICRCDGKWTCAEQRNICGGAGERRSALGDAGESRSSVPVYTNPRDRKTRTYQTEVTETYDTKSKQTQVDSSAWVDIGGHDSSFIKSGEGPTGGGYKVKVNTKYSQVHPQHGRFEVAPSPSESAQTELSSNDDISQPRRTDSEGAGHSQCTRCEVDTKSYPTGAHFDMRRGCVVYKCLCLCSGSYRCRVTSDNACTEQDKSKTCSNCVYSGMVFPGDMGFTVREGCIEKECKCDCDGTYKCPKTRPIEGCTAATANSPGFSGYGNFFPLHHGLVPAHATGSGYVTNPGSAYNIYQSTCTTCGSGPVVYHKPVHPVSGSGVTGNDGGHGVCDGCNVEGTLRAGNSAFTFEKDCIEFDCYCACGGSWKCSGRMALDCTPGFTKETNSYTGGCSSCLVHGTEYPPDGQFSLRQGCHEYKCLCNCDGGWSCPQQQPTNLCPTAPEGPARGSAIDPQTLREDSYVADQGVGSDVSKPRRQALTTPCSQCEIGGMLYNAGTTFIQQEECSQKSCECHCNGTWTCPQENRTNICRNREERLSVPLDGNEVQECKDCKIGSEVFITERDFQLNRGCYQHNCHCFCNGSFSCPAKKIVNICSSAGNNRKTEASSSSSYTGNVLVHPALETNDAGDVINTGEIKGCKNCLIEESSVKPLSSFVRQVGCFETLCTCQCNGKPSCPPSASVNVCELKDSKPQHERAGCKVGERKIFTRVFAHVQNCLQRTCICHDDGSWSCRKSTKDPRVC